MWSFAVTVFLGAFLLFQVQPLTGRFVLPWFGGGPSVWTVCMLFFQLLLLLGYTYAHFLTGIRSRRRQVTLHALLLAGSLLLLPISPDSGWKPGPDDAPLSRILLLLTVAVGGPYLLLSTTGPLMQHWFSLQYPGRSPYRLYALSNTGSLLALMSYPLLFEPLLRLQTQVFFWGTGYAAYVAVAVWCGWRFLRSQSELPQADSVSSVPAESRSAAPSLLTKLLWLLLSAAGSVMLLAVTNQLCLDVATVPFLWVLPLSLYLLTFIVCFEHDRWYHRGVNGVCLLLSLPVAAEVLQNGANVGMLMQIVIGSAVLFSCCMGCHGELYRLRPGSGHLTIYFMIISAGGVLGGLFVALLAPRLFTGYHEYPLAMVCCPLILLLTLTVQQAWKKVFTAGFGIPLLVTVLQGWGLLVCYLPAVTDALSEESRTTLVSVSVVLLLGLLAVGLPRRTAGRRLLEWSVSSLMLPIWVVGFSIRKISSYADLSVIAVPLPDSIPVPWRLTIVCLLAVLLPLTAGWAIQIVVQRMSVRLASGTELLLILAAGSLPVIAAVQAGYLTEWDWKCLVSAAALGLFAEAYCRRDRIPLHLPVGTALALPIVIIVGLVAMKLYDFTHSERETAELVHVSRNFYGVLSVVREDSDVSYDWDMNLLPPRLVLTHGQIDHGFQFDDDYWSGQPTTYYGEQTGIGVAVEEMRSQRAAATDSQLRVGVIGLGTGTMAAWGKSGDYFRFYEINPAVIELSGERGIFSYLRDSAAEVEVVEGDARIVLERELARNDSGEFDVLAVDAFSSDAIPVHLLTAECGELYRQSLRSGGILAVHISNRFLDLEPVTRALADQLGWHAVLLDTLDDDASGVYGATWVLISEQDLSTASELVSGHPDARPLRGPGLLWSDDYSGLWQVLDW